MMMVMVMTDDDDYDDGVHQDCGDIQMENYNYLLTWISPHFDDDLNTTRAWPVNCKMLWEMEEKMSTLGVSTSASIVLRWNFCLSLWEGFISVIMTFTGWEYVDGNERCGLVFWFSLVRLSLSCQLVFGRIVENVDIVFSTSASLEPSYVLRALGAEEDMAHSSIRSYVWKLQLSPLTNISSSLFMHWKISHDRCVRFGIGRFTSEEEVVFSM